ncbi:HAD family hydrolase [Neptunomonas japonica]|uniref:HAD family hydrolase n=1 Tax=Neptunomonas japonica TaxID=417574 RepID=UPI001B7F930C|nr:HAD-IA family hydrolase [Neptunomonas japonica]
MTTYLFDWGDTLMVDFPDASGKMCNWDHVEAITGAEETLAQLSKDAPIYLATGAADSSEKDIIKAFQRAGLNPYITGYFCTENLGVPKGSPDFFNAILKQLDIPASQVIMVGDSYTKDIKPALSVGITPVWFAPDNNQPPSQEVRTIRCLRELYVVT